MDLGVTVHTTLSEQKLRRHAGCEAIRCVRDARVAGLRMAALAKQRRTFREHAGVIRAMRCMTKPAVFTDRSVFPQIRAALFGMAVNAGIVYRRTRHGVATVVFMYTVTPGAGHLVFEYRVRERLHRVVTLQLVAVAANLRLGRDLEDRIGCRMAVVTIRTRDLITRMRAVMPAKANVVVMALKTQSVLGLD